MPTKRHGKVKHLLREGKAKVIQRTPFTVQLTYDSKEFTQPVTLGVDAGSKTVGISATTESEELYSAEAELRTDIVELLSTRRSYRRDRRNRKTRYRKARFKNRRRSEGWLAPSIRHKIESHLKLIADAHKLLPITHIIAEVASFDIQKIRNPEIQGAEYQQGDQLNFWNVREYVLFRDNHKCQGKPRCTNKILNVHHIESRRTGGDAPNNLITLCEECHRAYHDGKLPLNVRRGQPFKDAAFMGIMRWAFYERLKELYPNVGLTYGYITKNTRIRNGLEKTHAVDAYCITKSTKAIRCTGFTIKQVRKRKRSLHEATARKGRKSPNTTQKRNNKNTNKITVNNKTWCLRDEVVINGATGFISGFTGSAAYIQGIDGKYIQQTEKHKQVSVNELRFIGRNNNWIQTLNKSSGLYPTA